MTGTIRQFSVKGTSFNSDLTDEEALAVLRGLTRSNFAQDLVRQNDQRRRPLSGNQWAWVHKLATDAKKPAPTAVALGDVKGIIDLFQTAGSRLQHPKIHLVTPNHQSLKLAIAGARARFPGSVNVTSDEKYGESTWFGRIHLDGRFEPGRSCTDEITQYLVAFSADPARIAAEDGKKSGRCCYCAQPLTDERSLAVGWGPVCDANWGLNQWGKKPND